MSPSTSSRAILPPPFRAVTLRETGDAFAQARRIAAAEGPGVIVRTGRFDQIEIAVGLAADEPLAQARRAFLLCMAAAAAALRLHLPPEHTLSIGWPGELRLDGFVVGAGRIGWPDATPETETPAWLVFGLDVNGARIEAPDGAPGAMSLEEAGFDTFDGETLAADFARQLLLTDDRLEHDGLAAALAPYLELLDLGKAGATAAVDAQGDLLVRLHGAPDAERRELRAALDALRRGEGGDA